MLTKADCVNATYRDEFWHVTIKNRDGTPLRARVNGKCQTWKTRPIEFKLPMKHGLYDTFYITHTNAGDWMKPNPQKKRAKRNPIGKSDVRVVHNKLLGGWYIVRGPHQTPISGRFNSKAEAQAHLMRKNPAKKHIAKKKRIVRYAVQHQAPHSTAWGSLAFFLHTAAGKAHAIDYAKSMKKRNPTHSFKVIESI